MFRVLLLTSVMISAAGNTSAEQSLQSEANDPTASIRAYSFQESYSPTYHNDQNATSNSLQFQAAIPHRLWDQSNILRITIPYETDTAFDQSGLNDITVFNLVTFKRDWGRYGAGLVALLPAGADTISAGKWAVGPAVGASLQLDWGLLGLFNQNVFSVAGDSDKPDVNLSTLQPLLNVQLGNGWSVGNSEMVLSYDWDDNSWVSLPIGIGVNKLIETSGHPWQISANYERNFADGFVGPKDTFTIVAKILVQGK